MSGNPNVKIKDDLDALLLAIEPGISGRAHLFSKSQRANDPWANSGYGLLMTSSICQRGGDFFICSGSKGIQLNGTGLSQFDTSFSGTAIRMRIDTRTINKLSKILSELNKEGLQRTRLNSKEPILSASKVSRMLVKDL